MRLNDVVGVLLATTPLSSPPSSVSKRKMRYMLLTTPAACGRAKTPMSKADALAFKITALVCVAIVLIFIGTYYALYLDKYEVLIVKTKESRDAKSEHEKIKSAVHEELAEQRKLALRRTLVHVKGFDAETLCAGNATTTKLLPWKLDEVDMHNWLFTFEEAEDECTSIRRKLSFLDSPLSKEEEQFPLAYGMVVFKNSLQVFTMLSAFYHPQNVYVLGVDGKASPIFKREIDMLGLCFPNIYVIHVGDVQWCKSSVLNALYKIFRYLSSMSHPWRYFQYLSGVDLPLKTNLEMVRIFKQLNGTVNADVILHDPRRTAMVKQKPPVYPLWKSSMSALVSREAANAMIANAKTSELIRWLQPTRCSDESFWSTLLGNSAINLPGGYDAVAIYEKILAEREMLKQIAKQQQIKELKQYPSNRTLAEPFELYSYYISRYQVWNVDRIPCRGKIYQESCVYGIGDLPDLLRRPELVAHKFYWDVDPVVYFCVYKAIRERALDSISQTAFRGANYRQLPLVRIAAGEALQNVSFHINAFPDFHFSRRRR